MDRIGGHRNRLVYFLGTCSTGKASLGGPSGRSEASPSQGNDGPHANQEPGLATFYTIGHSNRSIEAFLSLLAQAGVARLLDVRALPRSRFNPQFNAGALAQSLSEAGIAYRHMPALGGLRKTRQDGPASPNSFWQNGHFRNFADYSATAGFRQGLGELMDLGREQVCAIMCAEADWRRCHRQIIADYLLAKGERVIHIVKEDCREEGHLNQAAVYGGDGILTYPAAQGRLL
jgi:uncharacterized protein (DUF488 family)